MKHSFEQSQQSQVRLFESFKWRAQQEKEESLEECESISSHPQKQNSSNFQWDDSKNVRYPSTSLASKNNLAKKEKSYESNTLPTTTGGAVSKKNRDNSVMVVVSRAGDNDSLMERDDLQGISKSTSTVVSIEKKESKNDQENQQCRDAKHNKESTKNGQKQQQLCTESNNEEEEEVSARSSNNENTPSKNYDQHDEVADQNKITKTQEDLQKSPGNKVFGRRGSRRVPASILNAQLQKDFQNQMSVKENIVNPPKYTGGFFLAMKLKKYANQMVSRLQSRRYLSLRSRHLQFFNDETIVPDEEKGIFKHQSNHHGDEGFEEIGSSDVTQSLKKQCTFFLMKLYNKHFSKKLKNHLNKIPLFSPSHTMKLLWDFLNMVSIAYYLIFFPLRIAFGLTLYSNPISFVAVILIQVDILIHLNTGFYDKGALVTDRILILMHYLSKRFITDILTMIPFVLYNFTTNSDDNLLSSYPKCLESMISLLFLIRVSHLSQIKKKIEERFYQKKTLTHIFSLFSLLMNTLYIAHIFSCTWIIVAKFKLGSDNTWMNQANVDETDWTTQYIYSLYFLIITMTTVGYGDIRAQNTIEHVLIIVIVLISSGVFSFSINQIGNIVQQMSEDKEKVKKTLQVINNYMNKKNINMSLQQQIREYLEYYLKESLMNDNETEDKIIEMLSEPLKRSLMIEANKIALKDSPIFRNNFSETTITKTVAVIQELRCTPEEILFYEGDTDNSAIFFVQQGKVELFIDAQKSGVVQITSLKVFSQGSSFGEISFFTGSPRNISIRSIDFTTLLMIKRQDFLDIVKDQSDDYENFCRIKDSIVFYKQFDDLGIKCISCNSKNHVLNDCPLIHYIPNTEKILKVFQLPCPMERQECESDDRVNRFNCLENQKNIEDEATLFMNHNIGFVEEQDWYDGNADDEDEMDVYKQYEDDDDEEEDKEEIDQNQKHLQSQTGGTINEGVRHYHKQSTHEQINQLTVHTSPYREDSQIPRTNQEIGNFNLNNNNNSNANNGSVHVASVNNLGSFIQGNSSSSMLHLSSQNNNPAALNNPGGLINPGNNLLATNNNYDKYSQGIYKLEVDDRRERNSSNLGLNDFALTPSGLLLNLANQNPGLIKETTNKVSTNNMIKENSSKAGYNRENSSKGFTITKRNRSASNSNINNLAGTPNIFYKKSSTLQMEEIVIQQQSLSMIQQQQQTGDRGVSLGGTALSHQPSMTKTGSQQIRNQTRRKNTEKTLRTNNKRQSTKMTIDSRMINGGLNERRQQPKQLTVIRKGLQENQIQNTLLALQGMENILLQNKQSNNNSNEFDIMKCFSIYFPHNNMDIVIFQLRKKNPHLYAKQKSLAKSNTKKLLGGQTMNSTHNRMSKMDMLYQKFLMSEVDEEKDKESQQSARLKSVTGHKSDFYKTPKLQPTTINTNNNLTRNRKHSVQGLNDNIMGSPLYIRTKSQTMKVIPGKNNESQQHLNGGDEMHDFSPKPVKKRLIHTPPPPKANMHFDISETIQGQLHQQGHFMHQSDPKQALKRHQNVDYGELPHPQDDNSHPDDQNDEDKSDYSIEENIQNNKKNAQKQTQQQQKNNYPALQQQHQQQNTNQLYRIASRASQKNEDESSHKNISFQDDLIASNLEL